MSETTKWLQRYGKRDEALTMALRGAWHKVKTDVVRFGAGQDVQSTVRVEGATVVVEVQGRNRGCVARQVMQRIYAPLVGRIEECEDVIRVIIEERIS